MKSKNQNNIYLTDCQKERLRELDELEVINIRDNCPLFLGGDDDPLTELSNNLTLPASIMDCCLAHQTLFYDGWVSYMDINGKIRGNSMKNRRQKTQSEIIQTFPNEFFKTDDVEEKEKLLNEEQLELYQKKREYLAKKFHEKMPKKWVNWVMKNLYELNEETGNYEIIEPDEDVTIEIGKVPSPFPAACVAQGIAYFQMDVAILTGMTKLKKEYIQEVALKAALHKLTKE